MKTAIFISVFVVGAAACFAAGKFEGKARFTAKAVDEEGRPLAGMPVSAGFSIGGRFQGNTDSNGCFVVESEKMGFVEAGFDVIAPGYYKSHMQYNFREVVDGVWQPWDPVLTAVVRKVVNPIPMYMECVETTIPETNRPFGFDLLIGDWVRPLGKGSASDLVFKVDGYWQDYRNNDAMLTLSFSQPQDGLIPFEYTSVRRMLQGSAFVLPRESPQSGYQQGRVWRKSRMQVEGGRDTIVSDTKEGIGYVFRVRSVTNEMGIVTNAYFGKFSSDIEYGGASAKGSYLKFTYYLNPTPNDRNLEFDPKRNLFTDLKPTEQVTSP